VDLIIVLALTLAAAPLPYFTSGPLRIALGLVFLLFLPGYALAAALFPRKLDLGGIERVGLSVGLSVAVVAVVGLALDYTPWGIQLSSIVVATAAFIVVTLMVAAYRRRRVLQDERFRLRLRLGLALPARWTGPSRVAAASLALSALLVVAALVYLVATPKAEEAFTEFYVLGPEGLAADYPVELTLGEQATVVLGIANHEQGDATYVVQVTIGGDEAMLTLDGEELDELGPVAIPNDAVWESELAFSPSEPGADQKVEFVLYRDGELCFENPPHLWIDVKGAE